MTNDNWNYTAAERRAIEAAFSAVAHAAEYLGGGESRRLQEALKYERRERSCITTARWLLVEGFANGLTNNPPASDLAIISEGIATATIIGAYSGLRGAPVSVVEKLPALAAAAKAAHEKRMARGLAAARASIVA